MADRKSSTAGGQPAAMPIPPSRVRIHRSHAGSVGGFVVTEPGGDRRPAVARFAHRPGRIVEYRSDASCWCDRCRATDDRILLLATQGRLAPGRPCGRRCTVAPRLPTATTMTFLGMIAGQVGTVFAVRTQGASLWSVGVFTNANAVGGSAPRRRSQTIRGDRP